MMLDDFFKNLDTTVNLVGLFLTVAGYEAVRRTKLRLFTFIIVALCLIFGVRAIVSYRQHQTFLSIETSISNKLASGQEWTPDRISEELHFDRNLILQILQWGVSRGTFGCKRVEAPRASGALVVYVYFNPETGRPVSPSSAC